MQDFFVLVYIDYIDLHFNFIYNTCSQVVTYSNIN